MACSCPRVLVFFFFFNDTATTEIYTLSLHDALPISGYMAGASAWGLGENLEWASGKAASPRAVVDAWMGSPEHRDVMFSRRFRHIGVGVASGSPMSPDVQNAE